MTVQRGRRLNALRTAVLVLGVLAAAPAAHAQSVTNPAKHPFPVEVTIDGQTYSDGRDTLPGYDDELCTPIPNVQYDFGEGKILYYNSEGELLETARWSEWQRISSYQTWLAQQNGGPKPTPTATAPPRSTPTPSAPANNPAPSSPNPAYSGPAPSSPAAATPAPSSPSSPNRPARRSPSARTPSRPTPSAAKTPAARTPAASAPSAPSSPSSPAATPSSSAPRSAATAAPSTSSPAPADAAPAAPVADAAPDAPVEAPAVDGTAVAPEAPATTEAAPEYELASAPADGAPRADPPDTRIAGVLILAALAAAGFFCMAFGEFRLQSFGRRRG